MNSLERLGKALSVWSKSGDKSGDNRLRFNEPLSQYASFAIGGPADLLIEAHTVDELREWMQMAWAEDVCSLVIGSGTNILVADAGVRGLVIVNKCREFTMDATDRNGPTLPGLLIASSGVLLQELARWAVARAWEGLEWAVGIPGTLGGAVVGNAGAYGGCMADIVRWVTLLQPDGSVEQVDGATLDYGYRTSALKLARSDASSRQKRLPVVLEVALQLTLGDAKELAFKAAQTTAQRKVRTPEGRCAGSIFKRTLQYPAGFLIEQAGLKNYRVGGAQVSPKHANFLMNTGDATAADVRALIEKVQQEVWTLFAQRLQPEIEFIGAW